MLGNIKKKTLNQIEDDLLYAQEEEIMPPPDIVAYNELRSGADLVRMFKEHILDIQPEYQRNFIWSDIMQTRFIDSLIKQLPIPSMCFSLDYKKQQWKIIDGLQRMHTLVRFLTEDQWCLSKLEDINSSISGKKVEDIKSKQFNLYNRVQNITLPLTILRCNHEDKKHLEYIFMVFHRLNSEGMKLTNQEIRNAIYSGKFNNLIKELNENSYWLKLFGAKKQSDRRFARAELVLRFFAFFDLLKTYKGKLTNFLNDYMFKHRDMEDDEIIEKKEMFIKVIEIIMNMTKSKPLSSISVGRKSKSIKISNVLIDSLMYSIAKNTGYLSKKSGKQLLDSYKKLVNSRVFSEESLSGGLMQKGKTIKRLEKSRLIFSGR